MNYDNLNLVHDYWEKNVFPHLSHHITISSFDDYLKQMSILPSGKWLKDFQSVKILRVPFVIDPLRFMKTYVNSCVTYCCPAKPEDGMHRIIYQISPTLHIEAALWVFVEHKEIESYLSMFVCFEKDKELLQFFTDITPMRLTGDTDDKAVKGFAGFVQ